MALLQLVNDLRHLLREEPVTTVAGSAPDLLVQIALVNRAVRKVLSRRAWSFLHRDDGYLFFPASFNGTNLQYFAAGATVVSLLDLPNAQTLRFGGVDVVAQLQVGVSEKPATSYRISGIDATGFPVATIPIAFQGAVLTALAYTLYTNTLALPSTVARLLSIRNEEGFAIRFETIDTFDDFDRLVPQDAERFGDEPEIVAVGGQTVPTTRTSGATTTGGTPGIAVRIFPAASSDIVLRYSYLYRPAALAADADALAGVPAEVQDLIVNTAFEDALYSNVEDDPRRGAAVKASNELAYRDLMATDRVDVGRRHVPAPFSSHRVPGWRRDYRAIPEP